MSVPPAGDTDELFRNVCLESHYAVYLNDQSNGKIERYHRTLKATAIRPKTPLSLADARRIVGEFVHHYNTVRLHSAIGYVAPLDKLEGRASDILKERDRKLEADREARKQRRVQARQSAQPTQQSLASTGNTQEAHMSISP